ncbi:uncharacterized membrane protein YkvA (DUF1232 family) [Azospirillum soli]|nr:uncharacterized membrane protein YkvA (DUF1232 family) [Azospirillum soli]
MLSKLKGWARGLKRDVVAVWLAARDPRTPWYARAAALCVAAYALSPIDLIPDFVPVLGYLDDIILVPLGLLLVIRLIPPEVMAEHRATVATRQTAKPVSYTGAAFIAALWVGGMALGLWWLWPQA